MIKNWQVEYDKWRHIPHIRQNQELIPTRILYYVFSMAQACRGERHTEQSIAIIAYASHTVYDASIRTVLIDCYLLNRSFDW
jgi:hypothetical protein